MSYNTVREFLEKCENPLEYSFDNECDVEEYISLPDVNKYFFYCALRPRSRESIYENGRDFSKTVQENENYKKLSDADGSGTKGNSMLIHDVYKTLWGWEKNVSNTFGRLATEFFDCSFGGDTMNSMQQPMNLVIGEYLNFKEKDLLVVNKGKTSRMTNNFCLELFSNPATKDRFMHIFEEDNKMIKAMLEYLACHHTIGNFVLVPAYMNSWRGFNLDDYWDKTLVYLQQNGWNSFKTKNDLKQNDFVKYVNYFYMWDYVDENGMVQNISSNKSKCLQESMTYFLEESCKKIKSRGEFMVYMLKLSNELSTEDFSNMRFNVFEKPTKLYKNTAEVYETIKDYLKKRGPVNNVSDLIK